MAIAAVAGSLLESSGSLTIRAASVVDTHAINRLICDHLEEGRLLPRELAEIATHASRFIVAVDGDDVIACAELAPLSSSVAEVRSLVVSRDARERGIGKQIITELVVRARREGFQRLCAFTHSPSYFVRFGFSIVPHSWVPEKIVADCRYCPLFPSCGKHAVVLPLTDGLSSRSGGVNLHG